MLKISREKGRECNTWTQDLISHWPGISVLETWEKSQVTSGNRKRWGSPISYTSCSATVLKETNAPVPGGLERVNCPSGKHSSMGNPILCLGENQGTLWFTAARKKTSGTDITSYQTILLMNNNNPKLCILHIILPFKIIWWLIHVW